MTNNFKVPKRREIVVTASILAIVISVFFILQNRKGDDVLSYADQDISSGRKERDAANTGRAAAVLESLPPAGHTPSVQSSRIQSAYDSSIYSEPIRVNSFLQQKRLVYKVDPVYPETAKRYEVTVRVNLEITVDEKGTVVEVIVTEMSPPVREEDLAYAFAEAAVKAVTKWRYESAIINGTPTPVTFGVIINFKWDGTVADELGTIKPDPSAFFPRDPMGGSFFYLPYQNYNGREYYTITGDINAPSVRIDVPRLQAIASENRSGGGSITLFIYINETGGIDGFSQLGGPKISALEEELKNISVLSPAGYNGEAIPSWIMLQID